MEQESMTEEAYLESFDLESIRRPMVTVDLVIFTIKNSLLHVLTLKRDGHPEKGKWSLPGGFLDIDCDESLEAAALRKLKEKTGVSTPYLEQLETIGNVKRDPRGWTVTVAYFALISVEDIRLKSRSATSDTRWVVVSDDLLRNLAFDHTPIFEHGLERLRNKVAYTALPVHLLPKAFTLTDLKTVFEIVMETTLEKSAFRRRIREADIVEPIPGEMRLGNFRPAQMYRVKKGCGVHFFQRTLIGPRSK